MEIFDIIKSLCDEKGVKVSVLERDLEFSRGSIYKMADSAPSSDKVRKLADYFDVSADYLLGRTKNKSGINDKSEMPFTYDSFMKLCDKAKHSFTSEEKLKLVQAILSGSDVNL